MRIKCGLDNAASIIFLFITYKIGNSHSKYAILNGMTWHNFDPDDDYDDDDCCSNG